MDKKSGGSLFLSMFSVFIFKEDGGERWHGLSFAIEDLPLSCQCVLGLEF